MGLVLDESNDEKATVTINGIELLIAENVLPYTEDNQIDYITNAHGQGFSIAPAMGNCC